MAAFVLMLREGAEAALIVAILLAYLSKLGLDGERRAVWIGTYLAVGVSAAVGVVLFQTVGTLEGRTEEIAEGAVALVAVGLLTWMIFWMGKQARVLRKSLEAQVDVAIAGKAAAGLGSLAFVAVVREGFESAIFLLSTTIGGEAPGTQLLGAALGIATAVVIGYLFYIGSKRLDIRLFFRATGALLVLFAAGLLAKGVHEFQEAGVLPVFIEHLWELPFWDRKATATGRFLRSLFGWTHNPSLLEVVAYWSYLVPVMRLFLNMTRQQTPQVVETVDA